MAPRSHSAHTRDPHLVVQRVFSAIAALLSKAAGVHEAANFTPSAPSALKKIVITGPPTNEQEHGPHTAVLERVLQRHTGHLQRSVQTCLLSALPLSRLSIDRIGWLSPSPPSLRLGCSAQRENSSKLIESQSKSRCTLCVLLLLTHTLPEPSTQQPYSQPPHGATIASTGSPDVVST